jgi:hypothetical protein
MTARRYRLGLLALCLLAGVASGLLRVLLFNTGSLDDDEVAYLLQAKAFAAGHLLFPQPSPANAYQPWFFVEGNGGFVSKYLPGVSLLLAASLRLTNRVAPVLALLAASVPLLVGALARTLGLTRPRALCAAALVTVSPLMLLQSALTLSYLPFLVLLLACWLLLAQLRDPPYAWPLLWRCLLLGVLAVAAATARPLDAVVLLSVPALAVAWQLRSDLRRLVGALAAVLIGAAPLLVAVGLWNRRVTGSALTLPFALLEPADKLGFGVRKLTPEDAKHAFGPLQGLYGLVVHFVVAPMSWFALGVLVLPAAAVAARRWRGSPLAPVLGGVGLLLVTYACFWGPFNASRIWGGPFTIGPFYALAVEVPLVLAAVPVLARLRHRDPRRVAVLLTAAALLNGVQLADALRRAEHQADRTREVLAVADLSRPRHLLFDVDPPYLGHPVAGLVNTVGDPDRIALAAYLPVPPEADGTMLLQQFGDVYGRRTPSYALTSEVRSAGPQVRLELARAGRGARSRADVLVVERNGQASACTTGPQGQATVTVTPTGTTGCTGVQVPRPWVREAYRRCAGTDCLSVGLFRYNTHAVTRRPARVARMVVSRRLPVATTATGVALLTDGDVVRSSGQGWLVVRAG